jgi:hypothetical protein
LTAPLLGLSRFFSLILSVIGLPGFGEMSPTILWTGFPANVSIDSAHVQLPGAGHALDESTQIVSLACFVREMVSQAKYPDGHDLSGFTPTRAKCKGLCASEVTAREAPGSDGEPFEEHAASRRPATIPAKTKVPRMLNSFRNSSCLPFVMALL